MGEGGVRLQWTLSICSLPGRSRGAAKYSNILPSQSPCWPPRIRHCTTKQFKLHEGRSDLQRKADGVCQDFNLNAGRSDIIYDRFTEICTALLFWAELRLRSAPMRRTHGEEAMLCCCLATPQKEELLVRISAGSLSESIHDCAKRQSMIAVSKLKTNLIKGRCWLLCVRGRFIVTKARPSEVQLYFWSTAALPHSICLIWRWDEIEDQWGCVI